VTAEEELVEVVAGADSVAEAVEEGAVAASKTEPPKTACWFDLLPGGAHQA